jgi:hypothetical protein
VTRRTPSALRAITVFEAFVPHRKKIPNAFNPDQMLTFKAVIEIQIE